MGNRTLEDELWDDKAKDTKPIKHAGCGGRVYWIKNLEHRCYECGKSVAPEQMEFEEEP